MDQAYIRAILIQGRAVAEPPKQTDTFLIYWRKPEEWGSEIYDWVGRSSFAPLGILPGMPSDRELLRYTSVDVRSLVMVSEVAS